MVNGCVNLYRVKDTCLESTRCKDCAMYNWETGECALKDSPCDWPDAFLDDPFHADRQPPDPVNWPAHYTATSMQCISAIEAVTEGKPGKEAYFIGAIQKYIWRYNLKDGVQDLKKAQWYLARLIRIVTIREMQEKADQEPNAEPEQEAERIQEDGPTDDEADE